MANKAIALIDDDATVRDSLATLLSLEGFSVSSFPDGESFLRALPRLELSVVLLDLKMPRMNGLEVLERLPATSGPPVVMMSAHGDIATAVRAIQIGAVDFIEKPVTGERLFEALERAMNDTAQVFDPAQVAASLNELTERESQVAALLAEGLTNKEAARRLEISPRTVEGHRASIFQKLDVRNVAGLVRILAAAGRSV